MSSHELDSPFDPLFTLYKNAGNQWCRMVQGQMKFGQEMVTDLIGRNPLEVFTEWARKWENVREIINSPITTPEWSTPYEVAYEDPRVKLLNFSNSNSDPDFRMLILPPQAGHHSAIADYGPGQSLVEAALNTGASVYAAEWHGATPERRHETIGDFIKSTDKCVDIISKGKNILQGERKVSLVGLCQGGWQSAIYTALYPEKINHLVLAGAPIDFQAGDGPIKAYANLFPMSIYENFVKEGEGNMLGKNMLEGFKRLNAYERYVGDIIALYRKIDSAPDVERFIKFYNWYRWTQDIPGDFYLWIVKNLFKANKLVKGELEVLERLVNLEDITCAVDLIAGEDDDITPPEQVHNAEEYLTNAKKVTRITVPAGHIGVFMKTGVVKNDWPKVMKRARQSALEELVAA